MTTEKTLYNGKRVKITQNEESENYSPFRLMWLVILTVVMFHFYGLLGTGLLLWIIAPSRLFGIPVHPMFFVSTSYRVSVAACSVGLVVAISTIYCGFGCLGLLILSLVRIR